MVVSVYVHSLQSMVVAPTKKYVWSSVWSSAQRAGGRTCRMAKPFGVSVCVYRIRPVFKDLFLFLKSHIWHGLKLVTELGLRKGFCSSLPCARVRLCCTLRRIMQPLLCSSSSILRTEVAVLWRPFQKSSLVS